MAVGHGTAVNPVAVNPPGPAQETVYVGAPVGVNRQASLVADQVVKTFLPGGVTAIVPAPF